MVKKVEMLIPVACKAKLRACDIVRRKLFVCDVWYRGVDLVPSHRRSGCGGYSWRP